VQAISTDTPNEGMRKDAQMSGKQLRVLGVTVIFAGLTLAVMSITSPRGRAHDRDDEDNPPSIVQIVALDECDPATFNDPSAVGPDFCKNVAVGAATKFADLFTKAANGTPDPNWDFEPDALRLRKGTILSVVNQGGEPHTFTEVVNFGGGFIPPLNGGEQTVPECAGGFSNLAVARTRILQGSQLLFPRLSKGEHLFECCIHPWMRVKVEVK
jgi:plastocyanin